MKQFLPINSDYNSEIEIKHSRFITYIAHTPSVEEAQTFIHHINQLHPKANHNCWAYIAGNRQNPRIWNCSDDGEPKGTAGKPMLNVLEHSDLCEITVVVTRYFGGVKLGAGGLVRAYSQAVSEALKTLPIREKIELFTFTLQLPHSLVGEIERHLADAGALISQREWTDQLTIEGKGSKESLQQLKDLLINLQHRVTYRDDIEDKDDRNMK